MSVFDENRTKCKHCNGYINHWDWDDNELHDSGKCVDEMRELLERYNSFIDQLKQYEQTTNGTPDYLLDLDATLADI